MPDTMPNAMPPEVARYLPARQWEKLQDPAPRRGHLLNALHRLNSVTYQLATYLPRHLVDALLQDPRPGRVQGQQQHGTLLFSDVSGFTALSERLAAQGQVGAEQLTTIMNDYFAAMLDILAWSAGSLLKFAGDALLVYFAAQPQAEQVRWAVRAAQRMMRAMHQFSAIETPFGALPLQMKIGLSTGDFVAASVGSAARMEYVLIGPTVTRALVAEGHASAGQIILDAATAAALPPAEVVPHADGFYRLQPQPDAPLDDFEIQATARRAQPTAAWLGADDKIYADIRQALRQIETLTPYIAAEVVEQTLALGQERALESEFRPTVTLFLNFTGFAACLERLGLEETTQLLDDYFNAMHIAIQRYGGIISRIDPYSRGSKLLALFGAPVAHEDDPYRAVAAALQLHAALAALQRRWQRQHPQLPADCIQQRIGITRGVTFAGQAGAVTRREYTVMGDDVNLAARLMSAAEPGQILISQHVYEAVAADFTCRTLPAIRVKGKSKPIPLYAPTGQEAAPFLRRLDSRPPLVGREAALAQARQMLEQALTGPDKRLALEGAPGIGKSHLADALIQQARAQNFHIYHAAAHAYTANTPYALWQTLIQEIAGITPEDTDEIRGLKLQERLAAVGLTTYAEQAPLFALFGLQSEIALLPTPAPPPKPAAPAAAPRANLFARLSAQTAPATPSSEKPNLWAVMQARQPQAQTQAQPWERLQSRIEERERNRLFNAVTQLLQRLTKAAPVLLFLEDIHWADASSRQLLDQLLSQLRDAPLVILTVERTSDAPDALTLPPLERDGTAALVTARYGDDLPAADREALLDAIHARSAGNPLFAEEIARWLQRTGVTDPAALQAALHSSSTLQELIIGRMDALPADQRQAIRAAAVIGDAFDRVDLVALLDTNAEPTLAAALHALSDAGLLQQATGSRYSFAQPLVRELIYQSQSHARRQTLHLRLAHHLADRYAADLPRHAELLAYHYLAAEAWEHAAAHLLVAGDKARACYAYPQARQTYQQALDALDRLPDAAATATLRARALTGLGDIALLTDDFVAATEYYQAAHASDPAPPPALLLKLALVLPTQGEPVTAEHHAQRAWEQAADAPLQAQAAVILAWLHWRGDHPADAAIWRERALPLMAAAPATWAARAHAFLAAVSGDHETAYRAYRELSEALGAALTACRRGDQALAAGDTPLAQHWYAQAADLWRAADDAAGLALVQCRQQGGTECSTVQWQRYEDTFHIQLFFIP